MLKYRLSGAWTHDVQMQQDNGLSRMREMEESCQAPGRRFQEFPTPLYRVTPVAVVRYKDVFSYKIALKYLV